MARAQEYFSPSSFNDVQRSGTRRVPLKTRSPASANLTHNLTLGHNGNLLPAHSSDSPPSPSSLDDDYDDNNNGTITEFYGPREPSPPRPYRGPAAQTSLVPRPLGQGSPAQASPFRRGYPGSPPSQASPFWGGYPGSPPAEASPYRKGYPGSPPGHHSAPPPPLAHSSRNPRYNEQTLPAVQPATLPQPRPFPDPTAVSPLEQLNGYSSSVVCPWCQRRSSTRVEQENGQATMVRSRQMLILCGVGGLVPVVLHWCQDVAQYCINCGKKVALQRYSLEEGKLGAAEIVGPSPGAPLDKDQYRSPTQQMHMSGVGELRAGGGANEAVEAGGQPRVEIEGTPRVEAEATQAATEMESPHQKPVFEMEHVNRGLGTQKRIRNNLGKK